MSVPGLLAIFLSCSDVQEQSLPVHETKADTAFYSSTKILRSDTIPAYIFEQTALKHLGITGDDCDYVKLDEQGNDITECWAITFLPATIRNLQHLESLQLNVNALQALPPELGSLQSLTSIDLSDNAGLTDIGPVTMLRNLKELRLYGCGLHRLPADIGKLQQLKELGLTGNPLDKGEPERLRKALPGCHIHF